MEITLPKTVPSARQRKAPASSDTSRTARGFDYLVITAANDAQAAGYRRQLVLRQQSGQIPAALSVLVVSDPQGRRVGSGGSTFVALKRLLQVFQEGQGRSQDGRAQPGFGPTHRPQDHEREHCGRPSIRTFYGAGDLATAFRNRRILILHAGGASKRLPAYAAQGKLFTPLPCSTEAGHPATLFDLLLANLQRLPGPAEGQVLVASGDVLLTFETDDLDFTYPGVVGVAYADHPGRARRHGVYVLSQTGEVLNFLQKPDEARLREAQAMDSLGRALIDTGLLSFDPSAISTLACAVGLSLVQGEVVPQPGLLADLESGQAGEVDLYEEVTLALARDVTPEQYSERVLSLPRNAHRDQQQRLSDLYDSLRELPFHAQVLPDCDFFHIGTSWELLTGLVGRSRTGITYGFLNFTRSIVPGRLPDNQLFAFNSILLTEQIDCGSTILLEGVHTQSPLCLAGHNILTGIPVEVTTLPPLPEGVGLLMLPIDTGTDWTAVLYGISDDFRSCPPAGSWTFFNAPLDLFLQRHGLAVADLWADGDQTLYRAALWSVGPANEVAAGLRWLLAEGSAPEDVAAWRQQPRYSLVDLLQRVDHGRLIHHRTNLQRLRSLHRPFERLAEETDLDGNTLAALLQSREEAAEVLTDLVRGIEASHDLGLQARAWALAALVRQRADSLPGDTNRDLDVPVAWARRASADAFRRAACGAVTDSVRSHVPHPEQLPVAAVAHDQVVWAASPARIDFAGGWSDTPPICSDRGGAVVNAAVSLNGQYPIQAIAKLNDQFTVNLTSIDLGQRVELTRIEELLDYTDPGEWASLPKACLCLMGLAAGKTSGDLRPLLRKFGGGIDLSLFSALPKGSGLGTSSILGAAVLGCLSGLTARPLTHEQLIERTSLLEQIMTTGGGWQDQVGGIVPGVKLLTTDPGAKQIPSVSWLAFDQACCAGRLLLYYTGLKRLARDILQNVVQRYLVRDRVVVDTIERLKQSARELRHAIDVHDVDAFAEGLRQYWELKKCIDPGSTNPAIEALIARIAPLCIGYCLPGAGGGGFLLMVAADEDAARSLRNNLTAAPAAPGARFFDFAIDDKGLKVCIL